MNPKTKQMLHLLESIQKETLLHEQTRSVARNSFLNRYHEEPAFVGGSVRVRKNKSIIIYPDIKTIVQKPALN